MTSGLDLCYRLVASAALVLGLSIVLILAHGQLGPVGVFNHIHTGCHSIQVGGTADALPMCGSVLDMATHVCIGPVSSMGVPGDAALPPVRTQREKILALV